MLAKAIAGALDLNDDGMVKQAVQQRGCDHGIAEDLAPFGEAAVGGEDHGALFVAGVDQLEEQVAAAGYDGQISDLVDDQQRGTAQIADALAQLPSRSALASEAMRSARVEKATLRPALTASTPGRWQDGNLAGPGGPSRCTTSRDR